MAAHKHGTVTVGISPTLLVSAKNGGGAIVVRNNGSATVYLGGANVTPDTSDTGGLEIAAGTTQTIPAIGGAIMLYAVAAGGLATVTWLMPSFNN